MIRIKRALLIAILGLFSVSISASVVKDNLTPEQAVQDIMEHLPALKPITWTAAKETHRIVVFVDNQCSYCLDVVKNVKKYNDAGLTLSFITVAPPSIHDQVIADMAQVWCSADQQKSLRTALAGFLPGQEGTPQCKKLVEDQDALANRIGVMATPSMVVLQNPPQVFLGNVKPEAILRSLAAQPVRAG